MNILHYTLGLPPYRTGGLTKYSIDLMDEQSKKDKIFLVFPGKNTINNKFDIKWYKKYKQIDTYEFINTLPVSLLGGVSNVDSFIKNKPEIKEVVKKFLINNKVDIIHIHTLMGLPKEVIEVANELNIKTIFTTHDYYGLCPKVNFIECDGNLNRCESCNQNSYSLNMIKVMQSGLYRSIKNTSVIKKLRKSTKKKIVSNEKEKYISEGSIQKYKKFREYYISMLENISAVHYNSSISKNVFEKYCEIKNSKIISITHSSINDNRIKKSFNNDKLKIVFLGPLEKYKGFEILIDALSEINYDLWELNIYGNTYEIDINPQMNIKFNGRYDYSEVEGIMKNNDVLVAPSIWNETFGFVILEAISYGMPVITNKNVGACDIIKNKETGLICDGSKEQLKDIIQQVVKDRKILEDINKNILEEKYVFEIREHCDEIESFYNEVLKESI